MRRILGFLMLLSLTGACSAEEDETSLVRIINTSDKFFDEVELYAIDGNIPFGSLAPSDTSIYLKPPISPNDFLPLLLRVGTDTIQPTFVDADMLPPTPFPPGIYTYEVDLSNVEGKIYYSIRRVIN